MGIYFLCRQLPGGIHPYGGDGLENIRIFLGSFFSVKTWTCWWFYLWLYAAVIVEDIIYLSDQDLKGASKGLWKIVEFLFLFCLVWGWCGNMMEWLAAGCLAFFRGQAAMLVLIFVFQGGAACSDVIDSVD